MKIENEFIPYEQALALKELGFDEPCFGLYYGTSIKEEPEFLLEFRSSQYYVDKGYVDGILAPTFSQAFRWFREKYHIIGEVKLQGGKTTKTAWYDYVIYSEIDWNDENLSEQWKKHEEAELECLKKLIEIVKNGKC